MRAKRSITIHLTLLFGAALLSALPVGAIEAREISTLETGNGTGETRALLERFVTDYRGDRMAVPGVFGVRVDDDWWHVVITGEPGVPESVELRDGQPGEPTFYYVTDAATLARLDEGTLNPGTAMVKAFSTDFAPLDVEVMEGFQPDETFLPHLLKVTFHFWNRGFPEIVRFGDDYTRHTHGSDAVIFYYQPGLRSGWFSIKKGQHVNADPRSQTNPFPSLFIVTSGHGIARIDGEELELEAGQSLFVPPGVRHEFWTHDEEPMQGVLIMFGEDA